MHLSPHIKYFSAQIPRWTSVLKPNWYILKKPLPLPRSQSLFPPKTHCHFKQSRTLRVSCLDVLCLPETFLFVILLLHTSLIQNSSNTCLWELHYKEAVYAMLSKGDQGVSPKGIYSFSTLLKYHNSCTRRLPEIILSSVSTCRLCEYEYSS